MTDAIVPLEAGRPKIITDDTISKLIEVFKIGSTDTSACAYAGISRDTYYRRCKEDQVFSDKMEQAKNYAIIAARHVVTNAIVNEKDLDTAKWYIEKHDIKQPTNQQNTQVNVFNMLKEKYTLHKPTEGADVIVEEKHDEVH